MFMETIHYIVIKKEFSKNIERHWVELFRATLRFCLQPGYHRAPSSKSPPCFGNARESVTKSSSEARKRSDSKVFL